MILDELVEQLFNIHLIEPTVIYTERLKAKKIINKIEKPKPQTGALSYMLPKGNRPLPIRGASSQRVPILPKVQIGADLKLIIAQQPAEAREHYSLVAMTLEEMI